MSDRMSQIAKLAEGFHHYPKTAERIKTVILMIKKAENSQSINLALDSAFALLEKEYVGLSPARRDYREKCFQEITHTIVDSFIRLRGVYVEVKETLAPLAQRMFEVRNSISPIANMFLEYLQSHEQSKSKKDKEMMFHLVAYMYLVNIEGIFDELARILYFFKVASKNYVPSLFELQKTSLRSIVKKFTMLPTFLRNFEQKKHLRNAIGHARLYLDIRNDRVRFLDVDNKNAITYDQTLSIPEFYSIWMEINEALEAFELTMNFLSICTVVWSDVGMVKRPSGSMFL